MTAPSEILLYGDRICHGIDRLMVCLESLTDAQSRLSPPVPNSRSVLVLLIHTIGSTEERVLGTVCGQVVHHTRADPQAPVTLNIAWIQRRWAALRPRLIAALAALPASAASERRSRLGSGTATVREFLLQVCQHIAEHTGHAELARDWILAAAPAPRAVPD